MAGLIHAADRARMNLKPSEETSVTYSVWPGASVVVTLVTMVDGDVRSYVSVTKRDNAVERMNKVMVFRKCLALRRRVGAYAKTYISL